MRLTQAAVELAARQRAKLCRIEPLLDLSLPHRRIGAKFDFLTEQLREEAHIQDTTAISANPYDENVLELIESMPHGLILDCGAGSRPRYFDNVVNFEIVNYESTDIIGVGERLP
jgi:hypothetical protein